MPRRKLILFLLLVVVVHALPFVNAAGELSSVPSVGPSACAWRSPMPNGPRCNELTQRCAQGCPRLGQRPSTSPPSESQPSSSRSRVPEPAQMSCSMATSFCISSCQRSSEAVSPCLIRYMAGKIGNRPELKKCLQRMSLSVSDESRIGIDTGVSTGRLSKELSSSYKTHSLTLSRKSSLARLKDSLYLLSQ